MIAIVQRVKSALVSVDDKVVGEIDRGLVLFVGIKKNDDEKEIDYLIKKITTLRIFNNEVGKFDKSVIDVSGELLIVSQFTLLGDCRKGRRPSFDEAAPPDIAKELYNKFVEKAKLTGLNVATGEFQAYMVVKIENDGPVTMIINSITM